MANAKRSANDFVFDRIIGEGSFSVVYLAKDIHTKCYCAVKVCEKSHIYREKMQKAILREKQIMKVLSDDKSPYHIKLLSTFQDDTRLYFVLNYCVNGELLSFINQREIFDAKAAVFYAAEILLALEHLHKIGIIHRDVKPENILLNERMHIQLTDFGSAVFLTDPSGQNEDSFDSKYSYRNRKNTFVGTAQYVSPEMLTNKKITGMCDLWAFACIVYQMIANHPPFSGGNEYAIFQKIHSLDFSFPDDFPYDAKNLIQSILCIESTQRLGADDDVKSNGYISVRNHPYFASLNNDWDLINQKPPSQLLAVAKTDDTLEVDASNSQTGLSERQIARLLCLSLHDDSDSKPNARVRKGLLDITPEEHEERLKKQSESNIYHKFVENNLILRQGLIDKKKGFFPRRRMFLLTTGPQLYYVDPASMVLKGRVPFCKEMRTEAKNFRNFYIHVPGRTYILEDTSNNAPGWCEAVEEVRSHTFDDAASTSADAHLVNVFSNVPGNRKSSKNSIFNLNIRKMGMIEKS